jgi:hypothetical protein
MRTKSYERGIALVMTLLAAIVLSAIAAGLTLTTSTEMRIAANFASAEAAAYAAESAVARALLDLPLLVDWTPVIAGPMLSGFVDGPPSGSRILDDKSSVDLARVVNMANCQKPSACTVADMDASTAARPWGPNNPRWRLFAYGPLRTVQPGGAVESPFYVVALVGDDPAENDGDATHDGAPPANPGAGVLAIRGEAFGPGGAHAVVEATVAAAFDAAGQVLPAVRVLSWRPNP